MNKIEPSELIINKDGSIFHLHLKPEDIADIIILVGDPNRVNVIAEFFNEIELKKSNREFYTITGTFNNKRITAISTGIGTDNIDIVVNELDALANIDFNTRTIKDKHRSLRFIRIGTTGGLQSDLAVDSYILSEMACGFDGLINFYANRDEISNLEIESAFLKHTEWNKKLTTPYFVDASENLMAMFNDIPKGITISAPGFYGPQGRILRINTQDPDLNNKIKSFRFDNKRFTNFEMECSAIYGLSKHLGHEALTICAIIANRSNMTFSKDYHPVIKILIEKVLNKLTETNQK